MDFYSIAQVNSSLYSDGKKNIMRNKFFISATLVFTVLTLLISACDDTANSLEENFNGGTPAIVTTSPQDGDSDIVRFRSVSVSFTIAMDPATINDSTFVLKRDSAVVEGTVEYEGNTAHFIPLNTFDAQTEYTALITDDVKSIAGTPIESEKTWSFITGGETETREAVDPGTSRNYVILAETAIQVDTTSTISGDIGLSPADRNQITGLEMTDATSYATSPRVSGRIYTSDMAAPTPSNLVTAVEDMISAYDNANSRTEPDFTDLFDGDLSGRTLSPGLYNWSSSIQISSDITISGNEDDVWIFQVDGNLNLISEVEVVVTGGARVSNIFWQVSGETLIGNGAHMEGIILSMNDIILEEGASFKGRLLSQSAIMLNSNIVNEP